MAATACIAGFSSHIKETDPADRLVIAALCNPAFDLAEESRKTGFSRKDDSERPNELSPGFSFMTSGATRPAPDGAAIMDDE